MKQHSFTIYFSEKVLILCRQTSLLVRIPITIIALVFFSSEIFHYLWFFFAQISFFEYFFLTLLIKQNLPQDPDKSGSPSYESPYFSAGKPQV